MRIDWRKPPRSCDAKVWPIDDQRSMNRPETSPSPPAAPGGRVLLISPRTFSYQDSIVAAIQELGYDVTWWDERASTAAMYKVALRLFPALTRRLSISHYARLLDALPRPEVRRVLVIKGESLSLPVVERLRDALPGVPLYLYLWDSVDNVSGVETLATKFDAVATFDPVDAKRRGWRLRPLFSRVLSSQEGDGSPKDFDWSFIGTLHSDRHLVIQRLVRRAPTMRHFVFCYSPSRIILWVRHLVDRSLWKAAPGTLSTEPLSPSTVKSIVERSRSVLDVEHPKQRGLTMRTIETLMSNCKLVTTNRHVRESALYHPSRVHIIDRDDPEIPEEFLRQPFEPHPADVRERHSIRGWAAELLSLTEPDQRTAPV